MASDLACTLHQFPELFNLHLVRGFHFGRHPRRLVAPFVPPRPLGGEVGEGIEFQGSAEPLLVDPVAPLDFAVVLGCPRADEFVATADLEAKPLEEIRAVPVDGGKAAPFGARPVGELEAVVGLHLLRLVSEEGDRLLEPLDGFVHGMLAGVMEEPLPGRLIEVGVLVEPALEARGFAFGRHVFHVDLPFIAGVLRGVALLVVLFLPVPLVRLVAIEPFKASQSRRVRRLAPFEAVEPDPDVHRAAAVPLRLVAEAFYLVGRLFGRLPRVIRFRRVGASPFLFLPKSLQGQDAFIL